MIPWTIATSRGTIEARTERSDWPGLDLPGVTLQTVTWLEASDGWVVLATYAERVTALHSVPARGRRGRMPRELLLAHSRLTLQPHAVIQQAVVCTLEQLREALRAEREIAAWLAG